MCLKIRTSKMIKSSTLTALSCFMRKSLADTYIIIIATDVDAPDIDYIHSLNKPIWFHLLENDSKGSQYYRSDFKTKLDLCAVWTKALSSCLHLISDILLHDEFALKCFLYLFLLLFFVCLVCLYFQRTTKSIYCINSTLMHQPRSEFSSV